MYAHGHKRVVHVACPTDGHRRRRDAIFQDELPSEEPSDELAETGVGITVCAAAAADGRSELGVCVGGVVVCVFCLFVCLFFCWFCFGGCGFVCFVVFVCVVVCFFVVF